MRSAPSLEVCHTLLVLKFDFVITRTLVVQWLERPISNSEGREFDYRPGHEIFRCLGRACNFSLFQEENIPWSICVLLTSPLIKKLVYYDTLCFFSRKLTSHVCPLVAFHPSTTNFCPHRVFHMNSLLPS